MEQESVRLAVLQDALERRLDVCSSEGYLNVFPQSLMSSYLVDYIGLVVCTRGSYSFKVNEENMEARAGETLFLTENVHFQIESVSADLEYSLLFYRITPIRDILGNTVMMMRLYATLNPRPFIVLATGEEYALADYTQLLPSASYTESTMFDGHERKLLMLSLTYRLCSIFNRKVVQGGEASGHKIDIFVKLITLISDHYPKERSVSFYADRLCLSPKYLSSMVKGICGYTVQDLVFKAIIRRAIFLMTSTSKTIQEISDELNFPNASAFGTFFKKHTGLSPKNYRISSGE
ncbi:MAG: helix-turn-helix domain-containing protein [Prevotella sp.]|nr:helix-turn-helix domain-containing protein [Prevotella sp.]